MLDPSTPLAFAERMGWDILALSARHATEQLVTPLGHKDPFDELLLVQAQEEGLRLHTRDGRLAFHPLAIGAEAR